ncbi:unnamed protein product [Mucor hiemalis]
MEAHELELQNIKFECLALSKKIDHVDKNNLVNNRVYSLEPENQLAFDRSNYAELVTKYDVSNAALLGIEHTMAEKSAEFETSISKMEAKQNLNINSIKDQCEKFIQRLRVDHAKALKRAAECKSISAERISPAKEVHREKVTFMEENEPLFKDELAKAIEMDNKSKEQVRQAKIVNVEISIYEQIEQLSPLTQDKNDAHYLCDQPDQECAYSPEIQKIELEHQTVKPTGLLQSSNAKYSQSTRELENVLTSESLLGDNATLIQDEVDDLSVAEDCTDTTRNRNNIKTTEAKLQAIIEQHQKELGALQYQFQHLLDMKDKELDNLYYMMKSRKRLTNEVCSTNDGTIEQRHQVHILEGEIKSKSLEKNWLESDNEQNEVSSFIFLNYT